MNILQEIEKDIRKKFNGNIAQCRLVLFQFFQLKYENGNNYDYIGYFVNRFKKDGKTISCLDVSPIATLKDAGILEEVFDIEYDDYFYHLLTQFYSETLLNTMFQTIMKDNNILCLNGCDNHTTFETIKNFDKNLFKTYEKKGNYRKNVYFAFRFFRLSDKYAPYEKELFEELKKQYGYRLNFPLVRGK